MNIDEILRNAMIWHGGDTDYDTHFKQAKKQIQELIVEARISEAELRKASIERLLGQKFMAEYGDEAVDAGFVNVEFAQAVDRITELKSTQPKTEVGGE